jgi:nucleoside-diphosphate-sugar epimerase
VIFISATSVYPSSDMLITEEHKTLDTPLASIEKLFLLNTNFDTTILRFGGLFGVNRNPGNFFKDGRIIKNPEGVVNMIHQDDCIGIIHKIIERRIDNIVFNACADTHPTRRVFYTKMKTELGFEAPVFEENQPIVMKRISSEKLKSMLNYTFKYNDLLAI